MRNGMLCSFTLPLALALAGPALAQPVAVMQNGGCGVALLGNGDVFLSVAATACMGPQGPWTLSGNVFSLSGQTPGRIVGISSNYQILAANGDWFQLNTGCPGTPLVDFLGNVFEITGASPSAGEEFTNFNGYQAVEYGLTTLGNVYRWQGTGSCGWMYVGALPIGPTAPQGESWGQLKSRYR